MNMLVTMEDPKSTPAAEWRAQGEPDPHAGHYDGERAQLTLGEFTDDALANAVFMYGNERPDVGEVMAGRARMPIVYLQAAKDRIRWLSRKLEAALAQLAAPRGTSAQILKERELTASAISGAIAFGAQGTNPPPEEDHWLAPFWRMGRLFGEARPAPNPTQPYGFVKPDTAEKVFFYEQDFYVLSNFSAFTLKWKHCRFDTSEAAYHYEKFPDHHDIAAQILHAPSAHEAFKVAERNKQHRRPDWDHVKVGIMLTILRAKAAQHEYVRRKLLATGDRMLIEDSWRDDFWGWGPNRTGQNVLGKLWMKVRAELRVGADANG